MPGSFTLALPGRDRSYPIVFQPLEILPDALREAGLFASHALMITDANVGALYEGQVDTVLRAAGWTVDTITIAAGEESKSPAGYTTLLDKAFGTALTRKTVVIALGGGVVGDLAGFAAATLLRGLPLVHVPTSVIAQVDSAIGGKTGINHVTGKNLIGAFYQPRLVLIDTAFLTTLPPREYTSGLAEVLKYAFILDADFFEWLSTRFQTLVAQAPEAVAHAVRRSATLKAEVVSADETEQGRRALLNFGHTFGHAIEKAAGYGTYTHGEAVALGMIAALHLSHRIAPDFPLERAVALVRQVPVPHPLTLPTGTLMSAMQSDKKKEQGRLRFVLLREIGCGYVTAEVPTGAVEAAWDFVKSETQASR